MKTKLLSKLMLVCFTAVMMVGCGGKKSESETPANGVTLENTKTVVAAKFVENDCLVCNDKDDHKISLDSVIYLIQTFDSAFIDKGIISNAGGVIDFESGNNLTPKIVKTYPTFKLHWGFEKIGTYNRLSVTCQLKGEDCVNNVYQGKSGIEGKTLFGTHKDNDFTLRTNANKKLTKGEIITHLNSTISFPPQIIGENIIDSIEADKLLIGFFRPLNQLSKTYPCKDIVFNVDSTLYEIEATSKRYTLRYYFGYDARKDITHKLRLILIGIDHDNKLRIFDASDKLLIRETSRPRP
jgi:hypothetical protein